MSIQFQHRIKLVLLQKYLVSYTIIKCFTGLLLLVLELRSTGHRTSAGVSCSGKEPGLGERPTWAGTAALPGTAHVALDKSPNFAEPHSLHMVSSSQGRGE